MISVPEAKQKIVENTTLLTSKKIGLIEAVGHVLAADVTSPISLPSFRQSSMDGYAISHLDIVSDHTTLPVAGESKAGEKNEQHLVRGTAFRIFTGAPVPEGATAVIMQEHTLREGSNVVINEHPVDANKNVRNVGQQIKTGAIALPAGTVLTPGSVGFLTGMNVNDVEAYRKAKVGILVTGDELLKPGETLAHGQVYESNSAMLKAALIKEGITEIELSFARDDLSSTILTLKALSETNDVVLASGGISVGDYDFVGKALEEIGAETIFYKVKQKPGKPLLFGRKGEKLFFALPGNPASSLVCYYEYVLPALRRMSGYENGFLRKLNLPSTHAYAFTGDRDEFLKAFATDEEVTPLDGQESFALRSFAIANALIYLPVSQQRVEKGDLVEVHLLPLG